MFKLNIFSFSVCPLPLAYSLGAVEKSLALVSLLSSSVAYADWLYQPQSSLWGEQSFLLTSFHIRKAPIT